ncbi:hypothetical protein BV20DRAFT_981340 [Pilatotrama ljubarskyi]|nr:hypothetical protein BV20DRAFT_981340 [Pilatotrama ljubarskyi]
MGKHASGSQRCIRTDALLMRKAYYTIGRHEYPDPVLYIACKGITRKAKSPLARYRAALHEFELACRDILQHAPRPIFIDKKGNRVEEREPGIAAPVPEDDGDVSENGEAEEDLSAAFWSHDNSFSMLANLGSDDEESADGHSEKNDGRAGSGVGVSGRFTRPRGQTADDDEESKNDSEQSGGRPGIVGRANLGTAGRAGSVDDDESDQDNDDGGGQSGESVPGSGTEPEEAQSQEAQSQEAQSEEINSDDSNDPDYQYTSPDVSFD